jgi:hypothetical protein
MEMTARTAGEVVALSSDLHWVEELGREALHGAIVTAPAARPTMRIEVEKSRAPFSTAGWPLLTRGVPHRAGEVVIPDVCTSGFDLLARVHDEVPTFVFRWRPPLKTRAAAAALRSRQILLVRAALLQYPALWQAGRRGLAPIHAPACTSGETSVLLAGPAGVGKTTLIASALVAGARATGDNLSLSDGRRCWGMVEPQRIEGAGGRRMPHGRGERAMPNRVEHLDPERLLVLRRADRGGPGPATRVVSCTAETAARHLVAGTYMAGELRRYWPLAATLTLATGAGPAEPPLSEVARRLSTAMPCYEVQLAGLQGVQLADLVRQAAEAEPAVPPVPADVGRPDVRLAVEQRGS